jgi:5'(3')-deoxyribonucleotidase
MNIYIDMDEVVADWSAMARSIIGIADFDINRDFERLPQHLWQKIADYDRLYRELAVREGARELVSYILDYQQKTPNTFVAFLTALPHDYTVPYAAQDKVHWANFYFPGIPVFFGPFSHDKKRHCRPGDILIDDRHSNCQDWRDSGGFAHEYSSWPECKQWLEEILK